MTRELFQNPTSEYRATPFWAWNCELRRDLLDREIGYMQDMGFGGFHMHVRVGMSTKYLSDDFMSLIKGSVETAKEKGIDYNVGNIVSSDIFYNDDLNEKCVGMPVFERWAKMGVLAVEMEAAGLYMTAARHGKRALAICTVSDHIVTGEATTSDERQTSFTDMMTLALEVAAKQG